MFINICKNFEILAKTIWSKLSVEQEKKFIMQKHYGILIQNEVANEIEEICEQIKYDGYAVIPSMISSKLARSLREKALQLNEEQNKTYGASTLAKLGEANQIRLPLVHDRRFLDLINVKILKDVLTALFDLTKSYYILNQQNIVINTGDGPHNQASWHRDFPYISGTSDTVHAYSALITLDEFTEDNGGTRLVPGHIDIQNYPVGDTSRKRFKRSSALSEAAYYLTQIFSMLLVQIKPAGKGLQ